MATALDPRFKLEMFDDEDQKNLAQQNLISELNCILSSREIQTDAIQSNNTPSTSSQNNSLIWQHFEKRKEHHNTSRHSDDSAEAILVKDFDMPPEDRTVEPLLWWKKQAAFLPELYRLNRKFLMVPATSVPSERMFSKAGMLCNDKRNRLTPKHVNEIFF